MDKQYNNELIGVLEEYQKIYYLSTQDGSINDENLKNMGFSVNTSGKIVNDTYYQKYLNIASQFMYAGVFLEDSADPNKYIYDFHLQNLIQNMFIISNKAIMSGTAWEPMKKLQKCHN